METLGHYEGGDCSVAQYRHCKIFMVTMVTMVTNNGNCTILGNHGNNGTRTICYGTRPIFYGTRTIFLYHILYHISWYTYHTCHGTSGIVPLLPYYGNNGTRTILHGTRTMKYGNNGTRTIVW